MKKGDFKEQIIDLSHKEGEDVVGTLYGAIYQDAERINTYLEKHNYSLNDLREYLNKRKVETVGIIFNLHVEEEFRGNGVGNGLMEDAIYNFKVGYKNAPSVDIAILVADALGSNGFDLIKWYEEWGFEVVEAKFGCPLMINCGL